MLRARTHKSRVGNTYGQLTVIAQGRKLANSQWSWICRCTCGRETEVAYPSLKNGNTTSCGCARAAKTLQS